MGYLEDLRALQKHAGDELTKPTKPQKDILTMGSVGSVSDPVRQIRKIKEALEEWHAHLSRLDPHHPSDGFGEKEWAQLCDDSWFVYEGFASAAIRQGWDAHGLFGIRLGYPAGGGLAQSLQGCRKLVLDGPHAHFTSFGVRFKRNAACGVGLPLIWEI